MSDLFGNHIVGFPTRRPIFNKSISYSTINGNYCYFQTTKPATIKKILSSYKKEHIGSDLLLSDCESIAILSPSDIVSIS